MAEKNISLRYFTSQSEHYLSVLAELRERAHWFFEGENQVLSLPFVLTCAAALECSLNDALIKSMDTHGNIRLLDGYLSMSLRGKLTNTCPIVTQNKFVLDTEHKTYKVLSELIRLRNKLVHNKSGFEMHEGLIISEGEGVGIVAESLIKSTEDKSFGLFNVGRFHDALIDLYEKLFDVYEGQVFEGNSLVICPSEQTKEHVQFVIQS